MSRYSEIFVIDRSNTDIYDENELLIVSLILLSAINFIFIRVFPTFLLRLF